MKEDCVNIVKRGTKIKECNCCKSLYCRNQEDCKFYKSNKDYKLEYDKTIGIRVPKARWKL